MKDLSFKEFDAILTKYKREIEKQLETGKATEHTHRPALKDFIESLASSIVATNEPRREECGAPDYVISKKAKHGLLTIGYVEAKDIGNNLHEVEKSEQLKRYRKDLNNLILTDYLEFRWYVDGERCETAVLAGVGKSNTLKLEKDGPKAVTSLFNNFLSHEPEPITNPRDLAQAMARLTHIIRDIIVQTFEKERATDMLGDLRRAFARTLIPDLSNPEKAPEFADMFAQTMAYGLFAARCNHDGPGPFTRLGAAAEIPRTNPFLRKLFTTITGPDLDDEPYAGFVDDLSALLDCADLESILKHFGRRGRGQDPVIHFYEIFLAAYDPRLREARGVYYTPEPVVSYIVRSVDHILKTRFDCSDGLADTGTAQYAIVDEKGNKTEKESPRVLILDPACGTGTFLYSVVDHVRERFIQRGDAGMWPGYVKNHLLPRMFGFELLMAPYAMAHFKLGMQLAARDLDLPLRHTWAYDFASDERLGVYLTNTLEEAERRAERLLGPFGIISDEADAAAGIKHELPIMVVLGNPPYSGHSANRSWKIVKEGGKAKRIPTFIGDLIRDYYFVDGKPLNERNPKWLQDDYVKFIRWAQWRIEKTGAGVLAFITNHGYLDNPTFRGMRQNLLNSFSEIFIVNLHGNAKKKEKCPDGSKDENVFDIQQGTAIGIFVKEPGSKGSAKVFHAELFGVRQTKYQTLLEQDIKLTSWEELKPKTPFYLFISRDENLAKEYCNGWKITDVMPVNVMGFQSHRDHFAIDFNEDRLRDRISDLRDIRLSDEELRVKYNLEDNSIWRISNTRQQLQNDDKWEEHFIRCMYRPFDPRFCYFSRAVMDRPRHELLDNVVKKNNLCLGVGRQGIATNDPIWSLVSVSRNPIDANIFRRGGINVFPLYLYPDKMTNGDLFANGSDRHVNINPSLIADMKKRLKMEFKADGAGDLKSTFGPEDIFHYIYAVLHSTAFRERYEEFLKIDFPRIPLTSDKNLFKTLCVLGNELVLFHLLDLKKTDSFITNYPVPGDNRVEKGFPKYSAPGERDPGDKEKTLDSGRVYISGDKSGEDFKGQYFDGVPPEVWEFQVGGYQVCAKWLKDRRGRLLSYEDLTHYQRIVVALKETMRVMEEIDESVPGWPLP